MHETDARARHKPYSCVCQKSHYHISILFVCDMGVFAPRVINLVKLLHVEFSHNAPFAWKNIISMLLNVKFWRPPFVFMSPASAIFKAMLSSTSCDYLASCATNCLCHLSLWDQVILSNWPTKVNCVWLGMLIHEYHKQNIVSVSQELLWFLRPVMFFCYLTCGQFQLVFWVIWHSRQVQMWHQFVQLLTDIYIYTHTSIL